MVQNTLKLIFHDKWYFNDYHICLSLYSVTENFTCLESVTAGDKKRTTLGNHAKSGFALGVVYGVWQGKHLSLVLM